MWLLENIITYTILDLGVATWSDAFHPCSKEQSSDRKGKNVKKRGSVMEVATVCFASYLRATR
jgi:hypothetical protein